MTIINKTIINLTNEEREAIRIAAKLAHDIFFGLDDDETSRFNSIMRASWNGNDGPDCSNIEVGINDLSCLLDDFQKNIDEFNN